VSATRGRAPRSLASRWKDLATPASWLLCTFGAVITFPVRIAADGQDPRVVGGILGILLCVAMALLRARQARHPPARIAALALGFALAWLGYVLLLQLWTCDYFAGSRLVIGGAPLPDLIDYLQRTHRPPAEAWDCRLVKEYAGDTMRMYPFASLAARYGALLLMYLALWLTLASLVWASTDLVRRRSAAQPKGRP
jgi:hypothetical protein